MTKEENGFLTQLDLVLGNNEFFKDLTRDQQDDILNTAEQIISDSNSNCRETTANLLRFYANILSPKEDCLEFVQQKFKNATQEVEQLLPNPICETPEEKQKRREKLFYHTGRKVVCGNILDRFS